MAEAIRLVIEPAIWQEPVRGGHLDPRVFGLSGLEQLRAFFRGLGPPPPLAHLTGMFPIEVDEGKATFTMPATDWLISPPGYIQLGVLAMLADAALGCAIQSTLPPATPYTTSDLTVTFLRPVVADGRTLVARGRVIHSGRSLAVSDVEISYEDDHPVAHGTSRCFILDPIDPAPDPSEVEPVQIPQYDTPDPYLRPVEGRALTQAEWDAMTGLEVFEGFIAGKLPPPPITHLTGLVPTAAAEGTSTFALPTSPWLTSPLGTVQGGATALLADTVLGTAVQTTLPARSTYTPLDVKVSFLRPVFADGRDLVGTGTVEHRGRTLAVANAEIRNADGKKVAVATGSSLIREGQPWRAEDPVIQPEAPA
ncbi:MAG TPA: PaaI family thioesterase [Actinomycetota bacterium]|nr:PaaI family thioesterase [Actinomycetota bacterium]